MTCEKAARLLLRLTREGQRDRVQRISNLIYDRLDKYTWEEVWRQYHLIGSENVQESQARSAGA
jgi:hypothetical protein